MGRALSQVNGRWRIASASVAGTSHKSRDTPGQDAYRIEIIEHGGEQILIVAASDGAGSARAAGVGSQAAVASIVEQARAWLSTEAALSELTRSVMEDWLKGVREQIADIAAEAESEMRDYAATLLVAVLAPNYAAFGQIGDGAIVVLTEEREWAWMFWPQHGEYANTTFFVTDSNALEKLEFEAGPRTIREVAIFSDGLEAMVLDYRSRTVHQPFFNRIISPLRQESAAGNGPILSKHLETYLESSTVTERTDDDVTLILASRQFVSVLEP
jgi:hypothetical protein